MNTLRRVIFRRVKVGNFQASNEHIMVSNEHGE